MPIRLDVRTPRKPSIISPLNSVSILVAPFGVVDADEEPELEELGPDDAEAGLDGVAVFEPELEAEAEAGAVGELAFVALPTIPTPYALVD